MEIPKKMTSKIIETTDGVFISTPKRKNWAVLVLLSLLTLQFTNGTIQVLFFVEDMPTGVRIITSILSLAVLYFSLKGLLWQVNGRMEIRINKNEMTLSKTSPLWTRSRSYKISEVKSLEISDETVSEGPTAMLQLLNITDKIKVVMTYGYETITVTGGIDMTEAIELKAKIKTALGLT